MRPLLKLLLALCMATPQLHAHPALGHFAQPADIGKLETQLHSSDAYERGKAIVALLKDRSEEAWELILGALEDPAGVVADRAQMGLVDLPQGLHRELLGKRGLRSKDDLVALRVAELLGRMQGVISSKDYIKALRHKEEAVRRSMLWSLERLATKDLLGENSQGLVEAVQKVIDKDREPVVRAQALVTMAQMSPANLPAAMVEFSAAKSPAMRAAAAESLALLGVGQRDRAFKRALADEAFIVRLRAYESVAGMESLEGMQKLVEALETESLARASWRIVDLLRKASGMKYGRDPRPWKLWLSEQAVDWSPVQPKRVEQLGDSGTASFVGMRVISTQLAFLIDFSGSMWQERAGKTRKQRVDVEMEKALRGLAGEVRFNIHPFESTPLHWQKELVVANTRNVKGAIDYFAGCKARGAGDFWSALLEAMEDPDVDTFMMLGDGAPSGGYRWDMELMQELFVHENRFRGIAMDALLVETKGRLLGYWENMCERSGGRCLQVDI
ncbi:MAG: HEAT repeat protein [Candidatus Paceibacteria bacterium]